MATDLKVQFFSHLNGLALGNNWGDLVRLLDTCLVNGLPFSSITAASIDANGDINLKFFAAHNAVLFQIVELSGFSPVGINGKYRIKGLPTSTQMILKAELTGQSITANGSAKLATLGYDIIYRDAGDVKRVYRAKNPRSEHPYIRVDETISDGTNTYNSAYAKSAMVGLIENMTHIDDYSDTSKLQLPLDTSNFAKNWQISGTGTGVVRGYGRWYWARSTNIINVTSDSNGATAGNRNFTIIGDLDAFYFLRPTDVSNFKHISGCGIFESCLKSDVIPSWFMMATLVSSNAATSFNFDSGVTNGGLPFALSQNTARFFATAYNEATRLTNNVVVDGIFQDYLSGNSNLYGSNNVAALQIPFKDQNNYLRGTLKHLYYNGKNLGSLSATTPILADNSMYVTDGMYINGSGTIGSLMFYLGELE